MGAYKKSNTPIDNIIMIANIIDKQNNVILIVFLILL